MYCSFNSPIFSLWLIFSPPPFDIIHLFYQILEILPSPNYLSSLKVLSLFQDDGPRGTGSLGHLFGVDRGTCPFGPPNRFHLEWRNVIVILQVYKHSSVSMIFQSLFLKGFQLFLYRVIGLKISPMVFQSLYIKVASS